MTIADLLAEVDEIKPSTYDDAIKIKWISEIDGKIFKEVISTHEKDEDTKEEFNGYTSADMNEELLVDFPYDALYRHYLFAMIDYSNGETDRYVNSMTMFNTAYKDYIEYFNRTHLPIQSHLKLF